MKKTLSNWIEDLFPLNRSLTGKGVRQSLRYIKKEVAPEMKIISVGSGQRYYDWKVPLEWKINKAYIKDQNNNTLVDFKNNNLHVVGYSRPVKKLIHFKDLLKKVHFIKRMPSAIPYRTSYYKKDWGFCLSYKDLKKFDFKKKYNVCIESKLYRGKLNYGEVYIKGKLKKEILFSTNICHPSLGNNELSGPILAMQIIKFLKQKKRKYSYRVIFIPETIGAIIFIKKNLKKLKENLIAGYVLSCVGDRDNFSKISSREGNSLADRILESTFKKYKIKFKSYSFLDRGSDERQFCSPGVDLPVCSFLRTKHGKYKEYHTSLDNLNYISAQGLMESFVFIKKLLLEFEKLKFYKTKKNCEPFLTKYKLKKTLSGEKKLNTKTKSIIDTIAYCDGKKSLEEISKIARIKMIELKMNINALLKFKIIEE